MTKRRPPALARTLLEWVDPANHALQGDLLEEFAAGRSRLWYWRQVAAAAGVAAARPVRAHGLSGLEPAMLGLIMFFLLAFYVVFVVNVTDWLLRFEGVDLLSRVPRLIARWPLTTALLAFGAGALLGRAIGAGGDRHRVARIVAFGGTTMLCAVAGLQAVTAAAPSVFLPDVYQQVGTTAAFIAGVIGSLSAALMVPPRRLPLGLALAVSLIIPSVSAAQTQRPDATPADPVAAILDAFQTHDLVALSDAHGNVQSQTFLRSLVRDPRFAAAVDDIVVEFGNARHQGLVDRFLKGEAVDDATLRAAWTNTTIANEIPVDEAFFPTVRAVNAALPPAKRLRVLLADPPIDWTTVKTRDDHLGWLAMRANPAGVFTVWQFCDELAQLQADVATWSAPALARVRGTSIGAADISALTPVRSRMSVRDGVMTPVPATDWRELRVEDQLDAILCLGRRADMARSEPSPARCAEPGYLEERLRRITLTGIPAAEAERARQLCAGRQ